MNGILLSLSASAFLGACALGPKVKPEELSKVKNVAIVGFELVQQEPKDFEISLDGHSSDDPMAKMPMPKPPKPSPHAEGVYDVVRQTCQKDFGWKMADAATLRKSPEYEAVVKDRMSGFRSLPSVAADQDVFSVDGVMDWWAWEKMSSDDRRKAITSLKTDAVLVVRARSQLKEGFSFKKLYGGGNYQPQVTYELKLYGPDGGDVFWSDSNVQGEPTADTVGHFAGIAKRDALNKLVIEASKIAAQKLKGSHDGASR